MWPVIGISPYLVRSGLNPYVSEFITRVNAEGGSLTGSEISALNTFANSVDLSEFDRLLIHGLSNQVAARVSLVNASTADLITEVNAPTWTANQGYTGNGTTMYLDTNFNELNDSVNYTQNSNSKFVYLITNISETANELGVFNGVGLSSLAANIPAVGSHGASTQGPGSLVLYADTDSLGLYSSSRNGTTRNDYKNGILKQTYSTASTTMLNLNFFALARNNTSVADVLSTKTISFQAYGSGSVNQSTFYTAVQALGTSLGWAV